MLDPYFFKDSFKHKYNKYLSIYYNEEGETIEDSERFSLDPLQIWTIKKEIIDASEITSENIKNLKAQGKLPLSTTGELLFENLHEELKDLINDISNLKFGFTQEKTKLAYEKEYDGVLYKISGHISAVYVNEEKRMLIYPNISSSQQKYQLEAFIHFLLLNEDKPTSLEFLSLKNQWKINYTEDFKDILNQLLQIFILSKINFRPFYLSDGIAKEIIKIDVENLDESIITEEVFETALTKDKYKSNYIKKEIEAGYFKENKNRLLFIQNYNLLNHLIFKNF